MVSTTNDTNTTFFCVNRGKKNASDQMKRRTKTELSFFFLMRKKLIYTYKSNEPRYKFSVESMGNYVILLFCLFKVNNLMDFSGL